MKIQIKIWPLLKVGSQPIVIDGEFALPSDMSAEMLHETLFSAERRLNENGHNIIGVPIRAHIDFVSDD